MNPRIFPSLFAAAVALLLGACAATTTTTQEGGHPERLLAEAGFRLREVDNPRQQQRLEQLPPDRISAVRYHGKTFFVYRKPGTNQVYVGRRPELEKYRQLRQRETANTGRIAGGANPPPDIAGELPGPNPIAIREYDDWGPLLPETE